MQVVIGPFHCSESLAPYARRIVAATALRELVTQIRASFSYLTIAESRDFPSAFWDGDRTISINPDVQGEDRMIAIVFEAFNAINNPTLTAIKIEAVERKVSKESFVWYMERREHEVCVSLDRAHDRLLAAREVAADTRRISFYRDVVKHYAVQWLFNHSAYYCDLYDQLTETRAVALGPWPCRIDDWQRERLTKLIECDMHNEDTAELQREWRRDHVHHASFRSLRDNAKWFLSPKRGDFLANRLVLSVLPPPLPALTPPVLIPPALTLIISLIQVAYLGAIRPQSESAAGAAAGAPPADRALT